MSRKKIVILGSTGSIGKSALSLVDDAPDRYDVVGLAAGGNLAELARQVERYHPKRVSVADPKSLPAFRKLLSRRVKVSAGIEGVIDVAAMPEADVILSAMVGAAGLAPTLAAVEGGKTVGLANKETMVVAGELVMKQARAHKAKIIPVDSEHSAIFQALRGERKKEIRRIVLTASGGPFRTLAASRFSQITVDQALAHPNWAMGKKITIDSATMMNKGLEVIEARWLFGLTPEKIDVVVHPQSVIHSMVEFVDASVMAQMGLPDMRTPIGFALTWPERRSLPLPSLDLTTVAKLTFEAPDTERFPCLRLAYEALRAGGGVPAALNGANEIAVEAFLKERIAFTDIATVVEEVMGQAPTGKIGSLAEALSVDRESRIKAREAMKRIVGR